jgi:RNA polymerase sigma factor (sigma-70 family)
VAPHPDPDNARRNEWLAIRCQLGERDAFDALVRRWHRPLTTYLRGLLQPEHAVDECLQEAWLRIVRGMPRLADPALVVPWMFSIARRAAFDHLRARYRPEFNGTIDPDTLPESFEPGLDCEDMALLRNGLAGLDPIDRDVLTLFYLDELSIHEVSKVLEVPLGTVKSRLYRARQSLRERLTSQGLTGADIS